MEKVLKFENLNAVDSPSKESSYFEDLKYVTDEFRNLFGSSDYLEIPNVSIIDKIDKTVRFIGAPISVMKPMLLSEALPEPGIFMVQNCLRTQNTLSIFSDDDVPEFGSFFTAMGALTSYENIKDAFTLTNIFLTKHLSISGSDLFISTSSENEDLYRAATNDTQIEVKQDTQSLDLYRHTYGIDGVSGRNVSYWIKNRETGKFDDVGNIIVIENDHNKLGVEIALGNSTLVRQMNGLSHVLDCYSLGLEPINVSESVQRKLEDSVLTSLALYAEGLKPSSHNNQTRILRTYMKAISLHRRNSGISIDKLSAKLDSLEKSKLPFNCVGVGSKIVEWVVSYEKHLEQNGPDNKEDNVVLGLLGSLATKG